MFERKTVSGYQMSNRELNKNPTFSVRFTLDCKEQAHDRKQNEATSDPPVCEIYNQPSQSSGHVQDKKLFKTRHPNSVGKNQYQGKAPNKRKKQTTVASLFVV